MGMQSLREWVRPYYLRNIFFRLDPLHRPSYFRAWQEYPDSSRSPGAAGTVPPFLFWLMADWHLRVQRTHHLASGLVGRGHRCFVVNPNLGRQFDRVYRQDPAPRCTRVAEGLFELHPRLRREPVYHERMLTDGESDQLASDIGDFVRCEPKVIQMVPLPVWMPAAVRLRSRFGWPIFYDCHDFIAGFPNMAAEIAHAERKAMEEADHLIFSSTFLAERFAGSRPYTLLRNAVDPDGFADHAPTAGRGIAGYFGVLDRWFDTDCIEAAAKFHPQLRFRLIGRVEDPGVRRLSRFPNVELVGELPHDQLPAELASFDVAMIPFRVSDLTRATNPVKLYEYFAQGKPVVSTALPEVERYGDLVYITRNATDFASQIERALNENDAGLAARRVQVARQETWDSRIDELEALASAEISAHAGEHGSR